MGYWNYRVMRHEGGWLAVHEVYYDEAGGLRGYTAEPVAFGTPDDDLKGVIRNLLRAARNARTLPVLEAKDFEPPEA